MSQPTSGSLADDAQSRHGRASGSHWSGLLIIVLATALQVWAVAQSRPLQSANDRSRWCTVWSLVERGTYHIDEIDQVAHWSTIDKVRHRNSDGQPWHFYSSKPPLFPTLVAGLYWLEKNTLGYNLSQDTAIVSRLLLLLVNVLPMFFALLAFRKSLAVLNVPVGATATLLIIAGFTSMLNPFLTTLNNHTPAAISVLFCLAAMIRLHASQTRANSDFAIVGLTAALTCCFELPAALFGVITFFYVLRCDWRATATCYVPAAVVPLLAFFVTNWICTGGIKPFYAYYGKAQYVYVHEGVPSYWSDPQGIDANTESPPIYLFHCVLGHHGILSLTPVFLLTLVGWWLVFRKQESGAAVPVYWIGAALALAVLSFYLTRRGNYNYGGNSAALRWMLWLTPFFWYGMIPAVKRLTTSAKGWGLLALLIVPSVYSPLYSMHEPWRPGWVYQQMEQRGWIDYRTKIAPFDPPRFSVIRQQPAAADILTQWNGSGGAAGGVLRLTTLSPVQWDGLDVYPWRLEQTASLTANTQQATLIVLPGFAETGQDIAAAVRVVPNDIDLTARADVKGDSLQPAPNWALHVLRGLPTPRAYNVASPRYFKYTQANGEKTALKCDRAASRVLVQDREFGRCWYRCDVLFCDELPFGVVQWQIRMTTEDTNKLVRSETWTCINLP
jgi:hypothetical protein